LIARVAPAKAAQSSIQNALRARNSSRSAADTGASGSARNPRHAAKADAAL
jgi:hypothetical protein